VDFVVARSEGIVAIDNQPLAVDTSPLATNIELIAYDCTNGSGKIEYNDRLRLLDTFIDVTPYVRFVNAWLSQAALITTTPLTLPLAKNIKLALVDGIFNSKRQLPITTLGRTWEATDQALMGMQAAVVSWDIAAAASSADTSLTHNFNGMGINTSHSSYVSASPPTVYGGGAISYVPHYTTNQDGTFSTGNNVNSAGFVGGVGGGGFASQANFNAAYSSALQSTTTKGPNIDWPPLNSSVTVSLAMTDMQSLINSINVRRTALQNTWLAKRNAINALSTIAVVIAYDVTTGWPS
jgi:hypothetical protein